MYWLAAILIALWLGWAIDRAVNPRPRLRRSGKPTANQRIAEHEAEMAKAAEARIARQQAVR